MGNILDTNQIEAVVKQLKKLGKKTVLVGGCFDILHAGHIDFLKKSKEEGDVLIVLVESDKTIKKLKGKNRPINNQEDRTAILSNLKMVDHVIPLKPLKTDEEYTHLVKMIEPDIIAVTKGDPLIKVKEAQAKKVNARIVEIEKKENYSTTIIAERLLRV